MTAERGVDEVSGMLAAEPGGVGRPISDRAAWELLAAGAAGREVVDQAEKLLAEPLEATSDELYLAFSRTGNRTQWERVNHARRRRLTPLVLAEGIENRGRFLPAIEARLAAICAERTWVMPAHDGRLENFNGTATDIDLASAALAWQFATIDWLLGDRLDGTTRRTLRANVQRRVIEPHRLAIRGEGRPCRWLRGQTNWNAVCLAGCTGAALALTPSRGERAEFIVAAERFSRCFLAGFTPDGYCSEGLGYWNYGFSHFVLLAETVHQASGGRIDLLAQPAARAPALFGARVCISGGVAPAFADCRVHVQPSPHLLWLINRRFGLGLAAYAQFDPRAVLGDLPTAMLYAFPDAATAAPPPAAAGGGATELRSWFGDAGVLIGRPAPGTECRLGVALKGGHNDEHHNHNDLGSYVVVVGRCPVLVDPGLETYTARTFSARRYEGRLLNSFGHPVPVVAGQLQHAGREAQARVMRSTFTGAQDTLVLDLAPAYTCPELMRLERTFAYARAGAGSLTISDHVAFATPQAFGTALITLGSWERGEDGALRVRDGGEAVRVEIRAVGGEVVVEAEEIVEDAPVKPTRIGIRFAHPVTVAEITVVCTPDAGA